MNASDHQNGRPAPCPEDFNLAAYVLSAADRTPQKTALEVVSVDRVLLSLDYRSLRQRVLGVAAGLRAAGVERGDKVVLRLGNDPAFPLAFLGANAIGALPVPTARALTHGEFERLVAGLDRVAATVSDDPAVPGAIPVGALWSMSQGPEGDFAATTANDPAYVIFTSGSSGQPKAVLHAQRAVWARRMMWRDWYGLRDDDRLLHAGAFNWTYTLGTGLMDPWAIGATALVHAGAPDRGVWARLMAAHRPTIFAAAPGVLRQIVEADDGGLRIAAASLRHALSAGEALAPSVRTGFETATGKRIHAALGMSEVSTYISTGPDRPEPPPATGWPQRGRRVAVLGPDGCPVPRGAEGDLAVHRSDPGLMLGYLGHDGVPALPLTGEWFVTGDRAVMSDDGAITHCGRADDLMNAGGFRVAPQEVEAALAGFDGIGEVAVATVEVRDGVEIIAAFYTGSHVDEAALAAFASARLARYKQPRAWCRVPALPRRANGKLARKELPGLWTRN